MEKNNHYYLKIAGSAELPEKPDRSHDLIVKNLVLRIDGGSFKDNSDGTDTITYRGVPISHAEIEIGKRTVNLEFKDRWSKKLRGAFFLETGSDTAYDVYVPKIIANLPEIIELLREK